MKKDGYDDIGILRSVQDGGVVVCKSKAFRCHYNIIIHNREFFSKGNENKLI